MNRSRWLAWAAITSGLLLTLLINYHGYLIDFNLVPGDQGDTRLVVFTLEHWFSALKGMEAPLQLEMFYPDRLALGYADGLILFAVPYAGLRAMGLDYFTSYQLVLMILTAFGYGFYVLLLRKALYLDIGFAVVGAVLLTGLNSMQYQIDIGKLLAFYLWPLLVLLLYWYALRATKGGWRSATILAAFSALLGLLFFTSYYPAWYFVFSAALFGVLCLGMSALRVGLAGAVTRVWYLVRARKLDLAIALLALVISLIPFGLTYAPLVFSNAERSFALVLDFSPTVRDIFNVSALNYAWSPLLKALHFDFGNRELQLGSPLLALALFGVFYLGQLLSVIREGLPSGTRDRLMLVLGTTAMLIFILTVKVRETSLWYVVYTLVPGASALRAAGRYFMVIDMIIVLSVAHGLNQYWKSRRGTASRFGRGALNLGISLACAFLILEQVNGTAFRLDKGQELASMNSYVRPERECQAFYISNPARLDRPIGNYQLDAMMASMKLHIPTINGYSGISPDPVFTMIPDGPEYQYGIMNWLRANRATQGICQLDDQTKAFMPIDVDADYARYLQLVRADYLDQYSKLFVAVKVFVRQGNDLSKLYPQFLEENGYLDASLGFQTGSAYHWIGDKYWIGTRPCGKNQCAAIGIVGSYVEIEDIIEGYGQKAAQIYFPLPTAFDPAIAVAPNTQGELLMLFPLSTFSK